MSSNWCIVETNDVHPKYGVMPKSSPFSWHEEEPSTPEGQQMGGKSTAIASVPCSVVEKAVESVLPLHAAGSRVDRPTTLSTGTHAAGHGGRTRPAGADRSNQRKPRVDKRGQTGLCGKCLQLEQKGVCSMLEHVLCVLFATVYLMIIV